MVDMNLRHDVHFFLIRPSCSQDLTPVDRALVTIRELNYLLQACGWGRGFYVAAGGGEEYRVSLV